MTTIEMLNLASALIGGISLGISIRALVNVNALEREFTSLVESIRQ